MLKSSKDAAWLAANFSLPKNFYFLCEFLAVFLASSTALLHRCLYKWSSGALFIATVCKKKTMLVVCRHRVSSTNWLPSSASSGVESAHCATSNTVQSSRCTILMLYDPHAVWFSCWTILTLCNPVDFLGWANHLKSRSTEAARQFISSRDFRKSLWRVPFECVYMRNVPNRLFTTIAHWTCSVGVWCGELESRFSIAVESVWSNKLKRLKWWIYRKNRKMTTTF